MKALKMFTKNKQFDKKTELGVNQTFYHASFFFTFKSGPVKMPVNSKTSWQR